MAQVPCITTHRRVRRRQRSRPLLAGPDSQVLQTNIQASAARQPNLRPFRKSKHLVMKALNTTKAPKRSSRPSYSSCASCLLFRYWPHRRSGAYRHRSGRQTVVDADGRLVTGLTKDDFEILEDDSPQTITQFSDERVPVTWRPARRQRQHARADRRRARRRDRLSRASGERRRAFMAAFNQAAPGGVVDVPPLASAPA